MTIYFALVAPLWTFGGVLAIFDVCRGVRSFAGLWRRLRGPLIPRAVARKTDASSRG